MPNQALPATLSIASPIPRVFTSIGINHQFLNRLIPIFPRKKYPLAWYIGLELKHRELAFKIKDSVQSVGEENAKIKFEESNLGFHITCYFKDDLIMKSVVDETIAGLELEVGDSLTPQKDLYTADKLLQKAQKVMSDYNSRHNK